MDRNPYNFLYPHSPYHGNVGSQDLVFNANLQEFSQRVGYICNFQTAGKLSTEEAYEQIESLWKQLKRSKKTLGIGQGDTTE